MDDKLRMDIEDAVVRALEAGVSRDDIRAEVEYQIENYKGE